MACFLPAVVTCVFLTADCLNVSTAVDTQTLVIVFSERAHAYKGPTPIPQSKQNIPFVVFQFLRRTFR